MGQYCVALRCAQARYARAQHAMPPDARALNARERYATVRCVELTPYVDPRQTKGLPAIAEAPQISAAFPVFSYCDSLPPPDL
jgi:hypothetical protein